MSGSTVYLLDTNMAAYIVSGRSQLARRQLQETQQHATVALSAISQGEILFGLENKPQALRLRTAIEKLFATVQILAWTQPQRMPMEGFVRAWRQRERACRLWPC